MVRDRLPRSRRHYKKSMPHEEFRRPRVAFRPIHPQSSLCALERLEPIFDLAVSCFGLFRPFSHSCGTTLRQIRGRTTVELLPTYSRCISQGTSAPSHRCKPLLHGAPVGQHPWRYLGSLFWRHWAFLSRVPDGRRTSGG